MVPGLGSIVEDGNSVRIFSSVDHDLGESLLFELRSLGQLVQLVDIASMMLSIMERDRVGGYVGIQSILSVGQGVKHK